MELFKKHRATVVISFIIGVCLFYLQPVLASVGAILIDFSIYTSEIFSDYYYKKLAKDEKHLFESFNNYILIAVITISIFMLYIDFSNKKQKFSYKLQDKLDRFKAKRKTSEKTEETKEEEEYNRQKISKELDEIEQKMESLIKRNSSNKNLLLFKISSIALIATLLGNYILSLNLSAANTDFRNRLVILLPNIGKDNVDKLNADWHLMKTKSDYDNIQKSINDFEKEKK